jgi:hypothetical protein
MNIPALRLSRRPIPWNHGVVASAAVVVACGIVGCDEPPPDRSAVRLAERVTHEQAAQNKRLADATKSLTQGSQQLVTAEAKARQEVIALQRDLRQDQADIGRQRDSLEAERRRITTQRLTDSSGRQTIGKVELVETSSVYILFGDKWQRLIEEAKEEDRGGVLLYHARPIICPCSRRWTGCSPTGVICQSDVYGATSMYPKALELPHSASPPDWILTSGFRVREFL